MNREFGKGLYTTSSVDDCDQGFAALDLYYCHDASKNHIARIIFWDSCGQFVVEETKAEIPLEIMEAFVSEVKATIKVR